MIVNEVITSAGLTADVEKVDAKLQELAAPYGEPDQVIEWYRGNPEQMSNIEMSVLEDQVVDHILSAASIEEVVAGYADVISGAAIAPPQNDADNVESDQDVVIEDAVDMAVEDDETGDDKSDKT